MNLKEKTLEYLKASYPGLYTNSKTLRNVVTLANFWWQWKKERILVIAPGKCSAVSLHRIPGDNRKWMIRVSGCDTLNSSWISIFSARSPNTHYQNK